MRKLKRSDQKGDTIVEVLIAAVIVGAIMVGSFVAAGFSINEQTKAEDRSTAVELAQNQIEELRSCSGNASSGACTDSLNTTKVFPYGGISCFYMSSDTSYTPSSSPTCAGTTENILYTVYIIGASNPGPSNTINDINYTVYVNWSQNQTINLTYNLTNP